MNSTLCLAYHTLENRDSKLPKHITKSLSPWIAGCDICQEVCPWNKKDIPSSSEPDLKPKEWVLTLTKKEVLEWDDSIWIKKLKGSALKRIKPWMWRRNVKSIIHNTY